jgi:hypothetical protein
MIIEEVIKVKKFLNKFIYSPGTEFHIIEVPLE